jgi:hypothetical protein
MQSLNERLQSIDELLIIKKRLGEGKYPTSEMTRLDNAMKIKI